MNERPVYKLSATMINSWLYYINNPSEEQFDKLRKTVSGIFEDNEWTIRGKEFEQEVFDGKHGKLSELVKDNLTQKWGKPYYISMPLEGYSFRISGKADIVDNLKSRIYDIKRVNTYYNNKYSDQSTCQHYIYLKLFPHIKDFYYVVAEGKKDTVDKVHVIRKPRPVEKALEDKLEEYVVGFVSFLKDKGLWEDFTKHNLYKGAY